MDKCTELAHRGVIIMGFDRKGSTNAEKERDELGGPKSTGVLRVCPKRTTDVQNIRLLKIMTVWKATLQTVACVTLFTQETAR